MHIDLSDPNGSPLEGKLEKSFEFIKEASDIVEHYIKPNAKVLGPKYGGVYTRRGTLFSLSKYLPLCFSLLNSRGENYTTWHHI